MPELLLKIDDGSGYLDGDIICAFSDRHVACTHAEHICHIRNAGLKENGLRPDGLAKKFRNRTMEYRFERISTTEMKRITISDSSEEIFGPDVIDVPLFIARRLRHDRHAIFGETGAEVWYGGRQNLNQSRVAQIWSDIETGTAHRRVNYPQFPLGRKDPKSHFPVSVDDFDGTELRRLTSALYQTPGDEESPIIRRRKCRINWRNALGLSAGSISDVLNKNIAVDRRTQFSYLRDNIVLERSS